MLVARPAVSHADRLAVLEVAHAATRPEEPLEHFQALRLALPRRALATWWLLEESGRPVASLLVYPLQMGVDGGVVPGYGIGAVSTRPEARGRGHASLLCRRAVEAAEAEGRRVGLLYSAIPPALYERLGFRVAPGWSHVCETADALARSGPHVQLLPLDPRREGTALAALYERHHGARLHLHRDAARFRQSLDMNPTDRFLGVGDALQGYVRLRVEPPAVEVVEEIVPTHARAEALRAVADLAARLGHARVEGWFEPCPALSAFFRDEGRSATLPMVRGVDDLAGARFWPSDYF